MHVDRSLRRPVRDRRPSRRARLLAWLTEEPGGALTPEQRGLVATALRFAPPR